jgi:hypothetical protein
VLNQTIADQNLPETVVSEGISKEQTMELIEDEVKVGLKPSQRQRLSTACERMGVKASTLSRILIDKGLNEMGYPESPASPKP